MHTAVDLPPREIGLELFREKTLCADRREGLVETFVARCFVRLELRLHAARRERLLHLPRLSKRELGRACRDDQPAHSTLQAASTRPPIVDCAASIATLRPRARAAAVVTGPIDAAGARAAASVPTESTNAFTDEAEVNVTRSISPARRRSRSDVAPSPSAVDR